MKVASINWLVGGLLGVAMSAGAAAPGTEQLLSCSRTPDATLRLQCFDRAVAPLVQQAGAGAQLPATVPPAPVARTEFGRDQLKPDTKAPSQDAEALNARIASMGKGAQGTYLITLDNGQVWRHEQGAQAEYLKVGEAVTISRAALGSYRLTRDAGKSKNWVRVTRVR